MRHAPSHKGHVIITIIIRAFQDHHILVFSLITHLGRTRWGLTLCRSGPFPDHWASSPADSRPTVPQQISGVDKGDRLESLTPGTPPRKDRSKAWPGTTRPRSGNWWPGQQSHHPGTRGRKPGSGGEKGRPGSQGPHHRYGLRSLARHRWRLRSPPGHRDHWFAPGWKRHPTRLKILISNTGRGVRRGRTKRRPVKVHPQVPEADHGHSLL